MSRDKEFRARDKKVHKMTRDGLVEQNQTAGTEQRISQRLADVSFDKARPAQETLGRNTERKQPLPPRVQAVPPNREKPTPQGRPPAPPANRNNLTRQSGKSASRMKNWKKQNPSCPQNVV